MLDVIHHMLRLAQSAHATDAQLPKLIVRHSSDDGVIATRLQGWRQLDPVLVLSLRGAGPWIVHLNLRTELLQLTYDIGRLRSELA